MVDTVPPWLAGAIVRVMRDRKYRVDSGPGELNIVYVEGMDLDGTVNGDAPNKFNDLRCVIKFENAEPKIVGAWEATTEPGKYWTENRMNPAGAARIAFGQYTAWRVGIHNSSHEALVQRANVPVHRDDNEDMVRTGDEIDTGLFGINQHWGYDLSKENLGQSSAGCLVGRSTAGHREFMALVKTDPRYLADHEFMFTTTILKESDVVAARDGAAPAPDVASAVPHAAEYAAQWQRMIILSQHASAVDALARKLIANKARYQAVSAGTGVPWHFIAIIHEREASASFHGNLHNGQPLSQVTTIVPVGRGPWATWEDSAIDAIEYQGLDEIEGWPLERVAYECERYNGMGYRNRGVPSAYLWSFSNIYQGGKYIADGVWSPSAKDKQCGTMPLLARMMEIDTSIRFTGTARPLPGEPIVIPPPPRPPPPSPSDETDAVEQCLREIVTELRSILEKYMAPPPRDRTDEILDRIERLLAGRAAAPVAPTQVETLSPIDKALGGAPLVGLKTPTGILGIAGTVLSAILGITDTSGTVFPILMTVFSSLTGVGIVSKIDRGLNIIGKLANVVRSARS